MSNPEDPAKSYLLDRLTAEARDQFEERIFSDDDQFFEALIAEHDLIDEFRRGSLPLADDEAFREHLLSLETAHQRVAVAERLAVNTVPPRWVRLASLVSGRTAAAIAGAAAIAAAAILAANLTRVHTSEAHAVRPSPAKDARLSIEQQLPSAPPSAITSTPAEVRRASQPNTSPASSFSAALGAERGGLLIKSPFEIEAREGGDLLEMTGTGLIILGAGRHDIELSNNRLNYHWTQRVVVLAGKVTALTILPPRTPVDIEADPWAEVWIDGEKIGQTPLHQVPVTIGSHTLVFRHPQLGEKRLPIQIPRNMGPLYMKMK